MKTLNRLDLIIIGGILISVFSYFFGSWLGSQSGLSIMVELRNFLNTVDPAQDVSRQQTIFAILLSLLLFSIVQLITFVISRLTDRIHWHLIRAGLAVLAIGGLFHLYSAYQANTSGVILMAVGNLAVLIASLYSAYQPYGAKKVPADTPASEPLPANDVRKSIQEDQPLDEDPMIRFQRKTAHEFHQATQDAKPFGLAIVSVTNFEDYQTVFGDDATAEMIDVLKTYVNDCSRASQSVSFSKGAMMLSMPDAGRKDISDALVELERKMQTHGFIGEMLLPDGKVTLKWVAVVAPEDGTDLAKLTENLLMQFAM